MKVSEFFFKSFGTCAILDIALLITGWIFGAWEILIGLIKLFGVVGGITLVLGFIVLIWEE
jgi:hypothetical protein